MQSRRMGAGMKTEILLEDKEMIVCLKPAGLAVQTAKMGEADLVSELKNYLRSPYLGVIHRLDQPVSGVLVFAKNPKAAAELSRQNAAHRMKKTYQAIVCTGNRHLEEAPVELCDFLKKEERENRSRVVAAGTPGAKKATLRYRVLEQRDGLALLEIALGTGRHHQIRVQLSHAGLPLLGDSRYGSQESRDKSMELGVRNVALRAVRLEFAHPVSQKPLCCEAEPLSIQELSAEA